MRAVSYYIIVENIKLENKKIAGLEISDGIDSDNRYLKGKIISKGDAISDVLKEGDVIYYDRHAGHGITYKDTLYQVITIKDVVIVE